MATKTDFERGKIIAYHEQGMSNRQIAITLNMERRTIDRIVNRYNERGDTNTDYSNSGQHRKTDERGDRVIVRLSRENPRASSKDIAQQLANDYNIRLNSSTVCRCLLEADQPAIRPLSCPVLTESMQSRRLAWAKAHKDWTLEQWHQVIFSDETTIEIQPETSRYVRKSKDEPFRLEHFQPKFRHPVKVMIWGCMSIHGTGRFHVVNGMMDKEQYKHVLQSRLLPQAQDWYGDQAWIYQQDLAPCHTAKVCKEFLQEHNVSVLDWPGNSPDLNCIENLWVVLKKEINKSAPKSRDDIVREAIRILARDNELQEICKNLVNSMPKRVKACISAGGGPLKY